MGMRSCMKNTRIWRFVNTRPGKILKFVILLILDLIDVAVDWYFYTKVKLIEPGLVYGPPEEKYQKAVFAFCIVSTLVLLIETIQNADDLGKEKKIPFLTQSLTNFLTIVFEDVPLLFLNLIFTLCRDGDVSIISLTKASLCIVCVLVRFVLVILVYWIFERKKTRFEFICDSISTLGLILVAFLSIAIQLINIFPVDLSIIKNFDRNAFYSNKYFTNVGIYMRWQPQESANSVDYKDFRLWLANINEVEINKGLEIKFRMNTDFQNYDKNYTICITKSIKMNGTCYQVSNNSRIIKPIDVNSEEFKLTANELNYGYDLKLIRRPGDFKHLLGYIEFNMKTLRNNSKICHDFYNTTTNNDHLLVYAQTQYLHKNPINSLPSNYYFKYNEGVGYYSLFNLKFDLQVANQIWRTGIISCKANGDKGPKLNRNIEILC